MMEAVAAMATPPLALSAATAAVASSSCCCSSSVSRGLYAARWRGLESSSSLQMGGREFQGWKFVENSRGGRGAAWSLRVRADAGVAVKERVGGDERPKLTQGFTTVMKFGGSSVASAHRMREVAQLILSFPEERPVIVLSAMGKTTNNLLKAGEKAVTCGVKESGKIEELQVLRDLHKTTARELKVDESLITDLLDELEQLLLGIALMKELTVRTKDYLVSFGERLSTRLFAAYLNSIGTYARQYDAFDLGIITTDEFTNAEILETTYPTVRERLLNDLEKDADRGTPICVVTGFLGKGVETGCVTTLGRGGSDLTATALGKALGLREIQVWKDVDGVLTCDPRVFANALPVPFLTFDEASELAYFGAQVLHPQSMRPARDANIPVRVKNSYNPQAPGTLITGERDMSKAEMTSIVLKKDVTMLDIQSTRMLGQVGFLAKVFTTFEDLGISVDVVATSEVSISLTLDPSKLWERALIEQELDKMKAELSRIANVQLLKKKAIISLISNVKQSSAVLEKVFRVFKKNNINVQMISQGASKVNISMVVDDEDAPKCVQELHKVFWPDSDEAMTGNGHL
ncbi:hypothetical protein KC19_11G008600 [Ceratodon purpureus]|uniref:aspartate kinase n=1 Tax=Ceratodon purpureus TaxID=3225 RepID=A0A8T0G966_CERPU|nr:hypothetical protein KC19_11G008600 [Ceratodon purpureus]